MGFSRQEYWSRMPFPHPGNLPNPGIEPEFLALAGGFFTVEPPRKPRPRLTNSQGEIQLSRGLNPLFHVAIAVSTMRNLGRKLMSGYWWAGGQALWPTWSPAWWAQTGGLMCSSLQPPTWAPPQALWAFVSLWSPFSVLLWSRFLLSLSIRSLPKSYHFTPASSLLPSASRNGAQTLCWGCLGSGHISFPDSLPSVGLHRLMHYRGVSCGICLLLTPEPRVLFLVVVVMTVCISWALSLH